MFFRLLSLFIIVPLADLFLLLVINHYLTIFPTIMLVVVTGFLGVWLARSQWAALINRSRNKISQNQIPTEIFSDGMLIVIAGALLVTPGLITDAIGLSLLIPTCRIWYRRWFLTWLKKSFRFEAYYQGADADRGHNGEGANTVDGRAYPKQSRDSQRDFIGSPPQNKDP